MALRPLAVILVAIALLLGSAVDGRSEPGANLTDVPATIVTIDRSQVEQLGLSLEVLNQLNAVRANPQAYADILRGPRPLRGVGAGDRAEAAAFLDALDALPPLTYSPALSDVALFHARDIGGLGLTSHVGSQGTTMGGRFRARGLTPTMTAEELAFGQRTGTEVILSLIADVGVPGKPHRRDLFNPVFTFVGVGCAPHKTMGQICVINLSNGFLRPPPPISLAPTPANTPLFNCPPGLLPADPDALRINITGVPGQTISFSQAELAAMTSASNFGQQQLGETLGANPGAYNTLGSPPWTPPQDTTQLPRWCAQTVGTTVAGATDGQDEFGSNSGALYRSERFGIGVSYAPAAPMPLSGGLTFTTPTTGLLGVDALLSGLLATDKPVEIAIPDTILAGVAYRPGLVFEQEADVNWANWNDFDEILIQGQACDGYALNDWAGNIGADSSFPTFSVGAFAGYRDIDIDTDVFAGTDGPGWSPPTTADCGSWFIRSGLIPTLPSFEAAPAPYSPRPEDPPATPDPM